MGLLQTSASLYRVVKTPFIVMPDFNPNNSQIYLKWGLGDCFLKLFSHFTIPNEKPNHTTAT
jgi:hypothetical protein